VIISRTPFRISFFGGGTDYPAWYSEHGGAVLSTTIDKYCYITCRYLPPFFEHRHRVVYSKVENVVEVAEIQHPVVRAALQFLPVPETGGLEIHHDADLPARSGIGSSSSFTVGLLNALHVFNGRMPSSMQLAREAIHVERDMIGESVGCQDQVAAAFGGFNRVVFGDGEFVVEPMILGRDTLALLQSNLMLFFTGFSRHASGVAVLQIEATPGKSSELCAMHGMVDEAIGLLSSGALDDFGRLLHDSWMLKRSLTECVSTPAIDDMYECARSAGALGGKLLGAGGGGFILFYVPEERQQSVREALGGLLEVGFGFETSGSRILYYQDTGPHA
jgi:D-glycero-alpha-D-manno-heptose-7-phosphate kinase